MGTDGSVALVWNGLPFPFTDDVLVPALPAFGAKPLARETEVQLGRTETHLVVAIDSDRNADGTPNPTPTINADAVLATSRRVDATAAPVNSTIVMGGTTLHLVEWLAPDPVTPGLPNQHCLERLISAAIAAAYPRRSAPVQQWLNSRPEPPPVCAKEHAWSYMAGWYADSGGYEAFCTRLWTDPLICGHLVSRLKAAGVWRVAEVLAA